eukprot:gnl/MRDRNA2_/MRDRNA2_132405_c0_seq1.p1 gnl/MRDRNA2_/MRDRNA2_132405_c0~~gnl/MRDRNA2_/MRDRNA2_132405_c0_seq1.p1  ORF type:complete len:378 (+),score=74.45 gnl/MRDRNA2_/MRDRNA2_132405_c0_seq1:57-1190(+)
MSPIWLVSFQQIFIWHVRSVEKVPEQWSEAFSKVTTEVEARALLADINWPVSWLSAEHVQGIVLGGWWNLTGEIVDHCRRAIEKEEDDVLPTAKLMDSALRRVIGLMNTGTNDLNADDLRAMNFILDLGQLLGTEELAPEVFSQTFSKVASENQARALLKALSWPLTWISNEQIGKFILRSWWKLSREIIERAIYEPFFKANADEQVLRTSRRIDQAMRKAIGSMRIDMESLTNALNPKHSTSISTIRPALQWAQGKSSVHLNIKYSARFNAPGALRVENLMVNFTDGGLTMSADGEHSGIRKRYELDLKFFAAINAQKSSWNSGSVGKLSMTVAKKTAGKWSRLLKDPKKVHNIQMWQSYQEQLDHELKGLPPPVE